MSIILCVSAVMAGLAAQQAPDFPYRLEMKTDVPLVCGAALTGLFNLYEYDRQPVPDSSDIAGLRINDVNPFDRRAVYRYSETADAWSTACLITAQSAPLVACVPLLFKKRWMPALTYTVMFFEARAIAANSTGICKSVIGRARPYMYGSALTFDEKLQTGKNGFRSFYSGHTSDAFCCAAYVSTVFCGAFPKSPLKAPVWISSLCLAAATGVLRYVAGAHYPTDILAGALAGSATGFLVPVLHRNKKAAPVSVYPMSGHPCGVTVVYRLPAL